MELYLNGNVVTMVQPLRAEAVLCDAGRIVAAGAAKELRRAASNARQIDLCGGTLLPAFIDAHSHLSSYASSFLQVELDGCADFDEIARRVRNFIQDNGVAAGEWVAAKGYDHNVLAEKRHPTLALVDSCAPTNPLVLQHASGHAGVFNSAALKSLGVNAGTPDPDGGKLGRDAGELNGYMEENAFFTYLQQAPLPGIEKLLAAYKRAQDSYASYGISTIQDGMTVAQMLPLYEQLRAQKTLYLDLVAYAAVADADKVFAAFPNSVGRYDGHLKIGGYKIFLDGSPQARTAWMRTPYAHSADGYCGYGTMSDADVLAAVETAARHNLQILAHCNGDAAAQQFIDAVAAAQRHYDVAALRPVMIHAQLLGTDQLEAVHRLGIIPSFFVAHVYHWGDAHIKNFGTQRAQHISPTAAALKSGIRFTFHQDTPVIAPNMLETVWCALERRTRGGVLLGEGERISALQALKAVTINAAYQYFEEGTKGSIEPGKNADFVLLDADPLAVESDGIKDIRVLKTVVNGETVFERG